MTGDILGDVIRRLGRLGALQGDLAQTDAELLDRFARRRDESAFAALMVRHGPMVLGVCRRLLHDSQEAEDAFQAAFLVLARKAGGIQRQALLAAWLYGVANRVAARLRGRAARRRERVLPGVDLDALAADAAGCPDVQTAVQQEVSRLPDKYRSAVILCHLEGKTNEEAAILLRRPVGTVKSRLTRARELLRTRLARRGMAPSGDALTAALAAHTETASATLIETTIHGAARFAAGDAAAGGRISARAVALTWGVLQTMMLTKVKIAAALVLGLLLLGGAGGAACRGWALQPPDAPKTAAADKPASADKAAPDDKPNADKDAIQGVWQITDFEEKGKGLELPNEEQLRTIKAAKWVFTADKVVVQTPVGKDSKDSAGSYKLDSSQTPKEIDITPLDGPSKGKTEEVIYSLDGDVLKLCMPGPESGPRPRKFAADESGKNILLTLKRVKPDQDKPKDDKAAAPTDGPAPATGPRGEKEQKLLRDWCDTAKRAFEAHKQEFVAGKIVPVTVFSAAQRLLTAEVQRSQSKADRVAAYEANLERLTDVVKVARQKLEAGKIAIADVDDAECFRLEADFLLEREKAK